VSYEFHSSIRMVGVPYQKVNKVWRFVYSFPYNTVHTNVPDLQPATERWQSQPSCLQRRCSCRMRMDGLWRKNYLDYSIDIWNWLEVVYFGALLPHDMMTQLYSTSHRSKENKQNTHLVTLVFRRRIGGLW